MTTENTGSKQEASSLHSLVRAPDWLLEKRGISQKQWRAQKRREMDAAIKALRVYLMGAAYTPSTEGEGANIGKVLSDCEKIRTALKVKNWGGRRSNVPVSDGADKNQPL